MDYLTIPPDYARILTRRLLKQPRKVRYTFLRATPALTTRKQYIENAFKGSAVDLAVVCESISRIPISLHAETMDMFISHLSVPRDGSELPPEKLKLMDQALRGIRVLVDTGHTPPNTANNCSCLLTLANNWTRILDCAEYILNADFDNSPIDRGHLEKQISAVLHASTRHRTVVAQIHKNIGKRTTCVASKFLMRQDNGVGRPWSNEETVVSLQRFGLNIDSEMLCEFVEDAGGDPDQITDILTTRLRLHSKKTITMGSLIHIESLLYLIQIIIRVHGFNCSASEVMRTVSVIAKSVSKIAAVLASPEGQNDEQFQALASHAILATLSFYESRTGYANLPVVITIVRLGLFDVVLAISALFKKIKTSEFETELVAVQSLFSGALSEFLLYDSFVQVVVTALRPLVNDERISTLSTGVFGDVWLRFERMLFERYALKMICQVKANHVNATGDCENVSTL